MSKKLTIPGHVAIIMDGNRRWAHGKGLPAIMGHRSSIQVVEDVIEEAKEIGIRYVTLFAFSTENWNRPPDQVQQLLALFEESLIKRLDKLIKQDICLNYIGDLSRFSMKLQDLLRSSRERTKNNTALNLNIALNYGGFWDITQAAKRLAEDVVNGTQTLEQAGKPEVFEQYLATYPWPHVDLLIRTSGEHRLSNFLLWQCAYAEFYMTDTLWPDFTRAEFYKAVEDFSSRQRRYGGK